MVLQSLSRLVKMKRLTSVTICTYVCMFQHTLYENFTLNQIWCSRRRSHDQKIVFCMLILFYSNQILFERRIWELFSFMLPQLVLKALKKLIIFIYYTLLAIKKWILLLFKFYITVYHPLTPRNTLNFRNSSEEPLSFWYI